MGSEQTRTCPSNEEPVAQQSSSSSNGKILIYSFFLVKLCMKSSLMKIDLKLDQVLNLFSFEISMNTLIEKSTQITNYLFET